MTHATLALVLALCATLTGLVLFVPLWAAGLLEPRETTHSGSESDSLSDGPPYTR